MSSVAIKNFPDFLSLRSEFLSALIIAPPSRALAFKPTMRDTPAGRVRISVDRDGATFFVLFQRERNGDVPVVSRGNVVIRRDVSTGYVTRVVWFLSDDGLSFISLTPKNERTIVDFVVAGALVKGDYMVSRLIYQFFTNTFSYLYDSTRSGLDWSLVVGQPGPIQAASLASALIAGGTSPASSALIAAANDFTATSRYMELSGGADRAPTEVKATLYKKTVSIDDPRDPVFVSVPAWSEASGIALKLAAGAMIGGMDEGSAFIAYVNGDGIMPPLSLAIVPYRTDDGSCTIASIDARTRKPVDFMAIIEARPKATVRLFRLPLPTLNPTQE
ncbi:hypothetical protein MASR2M48_13020 [Spirochaetota bacterium]